MDATTSAPSPARGGSATTMSPRSAASGGRRPDDVARGRPGCGGHRPPPNGSRSTNVTGHPVPEPPEQTDAAVEVDQPATAPRSGARLLHGEPSASAPSVRVWKNDRADNRNGIVYLSVNHRLPPRRARLPPPPSRRVGRSTSAHRGSKIASRSPDPSPTRSVTPLASPKRPAATVVDPGWATGAVDRTGSWLRSARNATWASDDEATAHRRAVADGWEGRTGHFRPRASMRPMRRSASSAIRCLKRTSALRDRTCCHPHPPQPWATCGHGGATRSGLAAITWSTEPRSIRGRSSRTLDRHPVPGDRAVYEDDPTVRPHARCRRRRQRRHG